MKMIRRRLEQYLDLRRTMGFKLTGADSDLNSFLAFMTERGAGAITSALALEWATQPAKCAPGRWAERLRNVRHFAEFLSAFDPRTEIPSCDLLPHSATQRNPPYLFSPAEIEQLLKAAGQLRSRRGLLGTTYATLFALLSVTGMRVGEAVALYLTDLDSGRLLLHVRHAKFGKSRWVPIHPTTRKALLAYKAKRRRLYPHAGPHFFVSEQGHRIRTGAVNPVLRKLCGQVGIETGSRRISVHAFRHCFAIRTITKWYQEDEDAERRLSELSTFLGHNDPSSTYWYLSAIPELLAAVTARLDRGNRRIFS